MSEQTTYNPDDFNPREGIKSRYAKKIVNSRFYATIRIDSIRDFPSISGENQHARNVEYWKRALDRAFYDTDEKKVLIMRKIIWYMTMKIKQNHCE